MPRDIIPVEVDPVIAALEMGRARVIEGWTQRISVTFRPGGLAYCMMAAVGENTTLDKVTLNAALTALHKTVCLLARYDTSIVGFNDDWSRQKSDVVQAYDVAIELQLRSET